MTDTLGVRAVAMWNEFVFLEIATAAFSGIANEISVFISFGGRMGHAVCIGLLPMKVQRD